MATLEQQFKKITPPTGFHFLYFGDYVTIADEWNCRHADFRSVVEYDAWLKKEAELDRELQSRLSYWSEVLPQRNQ